MAGRLRDTEIPPFGEKEAFDALERRRTKDSIRARHREMAQQWASGQRTAAALQRNFGLAHQTAVTIRQYLETAEREAAVIRYESTPAPQLIAPSDIKAPPLVENGSHKYTAPTLTGPAFLRRLDELLKEAIEEGSIANIDKLYKIRTELSDFASELPNTHVDIERTLGIAGLKGMDQVLAETLSNLPEHARSFPKTVAQIHAISSQLSGRDRLVENGSQDGGEHGAS